MAVVSDVELVGIVVATADGHDGGISLNSETEFILRHRDATALAVDSLDTDVHEVGAVGLPGVVLWGSNEAHSLTGGLDLVSGDGLSGGVCDSLQTAIGISDIVPADLVTQFGVVRGVPSGFGYAVWRRSWGSAYDQDSCH